MVLILKIFLFWSLFAAQVVTESVGQVGNYIVTSREVQISMVMENILFPPKIPLKGLYEIRPSSDQFRNAVTSVLLEIVVSFEAENFNVATVSDDDLKGTLGKIEKAVAGKAYWDELDVSPKELKKFTLRKLLAKNFLQFKTSSMAGIITDQEAQAYYDQNRVKFGSSSFESFKANIKSFLAQQQLEESLRSWFEVVKRKYKVRNFIPG